MMSEREVWEIAQPAVEMAVNCWIGSLSWQRQEVERREFEDHCQTAWVFLASTRGRTIYAQSEDRASYRIPYLAKCIENELREINSRLWRKRLRLRRCAMREVPARSDDLGMVEIGILLSEAPDGIRQYLTGMWEGVGAGEIQEVNNWSRREYERFKEEAEQWVLNKYG